MATRKFTKENWIYTLCLWLALAFCAFTLLFFAIRGESDKAFMSIVSVAYAFIPPVAQRLFKFRMQKSLYVVVTFYTVCPLLGYSYNLYYILPWWDDILHAFAGVIFAMLGAYLPKVMCKDGEVPLSLCVFSAFFFSVAISGLWEIVEFTMDSYFGTDMQKDTAVYSMRPSYLLSELLGNPVGELKQINDVQMIVDGTPVGYYVDIGLLDTMKDVFIETLGAGVYTIIYRIGKGKVFAFEKFEGTFPEDEVAEEKTIKEAPSPDPLPAEEVALSDSTNE